MPPAKPRCTRTAQRPRAVDTLASAPPRRPRRPGPCARSFALRCTLARFSALPTLMAANSPCGAHQLRVQARPRMHAQPIDRPRRSAGGHGPAGRSRLVPRGRAPAMEDRKHCRKNEEGSAGDAAGEGDGVAAGSHSVQESAATAAEQAAAAAYLPRAPRRPAWTRATPRPPAPPPPPALAVIGHSSSDIGKRRTHSNRLGRGCTLASCTREPPSSRALPFTPRTTLSAAATPLRRSAQAPLSRRCRPRSRPGAGRRGPRQSRTS